MQVFRHLLRQVRRPPSGRTRRSERIWAHPRMIKTIKLFLGRQRQVLLLVLCSDVEASQYISSFILFTYSHFHRWLKNDFEQRILARSLSRALSSPAISWYFRYIYNVGRLDGCVILFTTGRGYRDALQASPSALRARFQSAST